MITAANGRPMPVVSRMIIATANSKPSPIRKPCHDMPLLPRAARIHPWTVYRSTAETGRVDDAPRKATFATRDHRMAPAVPPSRSRGHPSSPHRSGGFWGVGFSLPRMLFQLRRFTRADEVVPERRPRIEPRPDAIVSRPLGQGNSNLQLIVPGTEPPLRLADGLLATCGQMMSLLR